MSMQDEELFEERLREEMAKYDEVGFFRRLLNMFKGFGQPRSSREYKEALIELQRLSAPILAILIPVLFVGVLFVVTAIQAKNKEEIKVEIAQAEQEDKLEEFEEPPETEPPPDTDVDVQMDTPNVATPTEVAEATPQQTNEPQSPKVNNVDAMMNIQSPVMMKSVMGSSRSTGVRGSYTRGGAAYGDAQTEGAVLKALRWLKKTQNANGSWAGNSAPAMTGFAILTYLAHGETPSSKEFGETVRNALDFLIGACYEDKNGVTRFKGADGNEYAHLIATYALCEAYGMTKNPNARETAERALTRIIQGQSPTGGWDYKMNKASSRDDLSFAGWAIQALKAGKMAGIHLSGMDEAIKKAIRCLKTRNFKKGGFGYCAGNAPGGLTATGCLAMQLLGFAKEPEVKASLEYMEKWKPTFDKKHMSGGANSQYYSYYAAQCKYQAGMCKGATPANQNLWKDWNVSMKGLYPKSIVDAKNKDGSPMTVLDPGGKERQCGFWKSNDNYNAPVMATCLCALQLMVYYRYLPTTSLKATEVEADVEELSKDKGGEVGVTIDI